eukprot:CAMPEP_0202855716 /NCGR_PEP_ID=MMETSP1389-20130828/91659_1 /ASSEMBLY_ACC=CAM_ASM_000865 /TAXON_ID=302021 /ORGANISM="Rhodomonas sp., Strain CCMP768" /LENGTH=195 /DNA_ID=CAMNT_0049534337 /DNA_START=521 /DNA_END=1104 /DNA_ORIENTATION=+
MGGLHQSSQIIFYLSIVFLSPYWLNFCPEGSTGSCPAAYFNSVTFVVVLNSLYRIHDAMENPYDMKGLDDIFFSTTNELRRIHRGASSFLRPFDYDPATGELLIPDPSERFQEIEMENNGHVLQAKRPFWELEMDEEGAERAGKEHSAERIALVFPQYQSIDSLASAATGSCSRVRAATWKSPRLLVIQVPGSLR